MHSANMSLDVWRESHHSHRWIEEPWEQHVMLKRNVYMLGNSNQIAPTFVVSTYNNTKLLQQP